MISINPQNVIFFLSLLLINVFPPIITAHRHRSAACDRSCGGVHVPYPFGFSSGCHIHLNCSSNSRRIHIGEFQVEDINNGTIKVNIEPKCNRSINSLHQLFSRNYAPTFRNAVLLNDCNSTASPCRIPSIDVQTQFQSLKCVSDHSNNNNSGISCYSEDKIDGFLDYDQMRRRRCKYLLSSISLQSFNNSGVSLDVQLVELGWWLEGMCRCSKDADCDQIILPHQRLGYRCRCKNGFEGDGYSTGAGCHKGCGPGKYIWGQCGGKLKIAVIVGGIIAGTSLISLCTICICCFIRIRPSRKLTKYHLTQAKDINIPIYPYKEILKATNGFSDKQRLGTGAFGTVYAGKLHNDSWVAIKRIKPRDTDSIDQVLNEIKLLSSVSHPNLVRLLGCSIENGEQILVYEFMPNGTLCQHLQRERGEGLPWKVRLKTAAETAKAIAHLHSSIDPPIYHRDIKSSNILLDCDFTSKVADFGLSRLGRTEMSHISTAPQGTPGYLDPEYHQNFHLSDKSDVYSFGVVLIEIITAMKVVDFSRPQNEVNLAALACDRIGKGRLEDIIDPFIEAHKDEWTLSSVHKVAELAFRCLAFHGDMRPLMSEVASELDQIRTSKTWPHTVGSCTDLSPSCSSSSSSCSSSNVSEKPPSVSVRRTCFQIGTRMSVDSMERSKDDSLMSVQDPWLSAKSSPSSNSLLSHLIR